MERQAVESSQIRAIGYDPHTWKMEVQFKSGSVYRYDNVDPSTHEGLIRAESVGGYFCEFIKPYPQRFPFERIRGTDREEAAKENSTASIGEIGGVQ